MIKKGFTAQDAMRTIRRQRNIIPNEGFLRQLCQLNEEMIQAKETQARRDRLTSSYGTRNIAVV